MEMGWAEDNRLSSGTVVNNLNKGEVARIHRFYRKNGIFPYIQKMVEYDGAARPEIKEEFSLPADEWPAIAQNLVDIDSEEFGLTTEADAPWLFYFNFPLFMVDFDGEIKYNPRYDAENREEDKPTHKVVWDGHKESLLLNGEMEGEYFPFVKRDGIFRPGLLTAFIRDSKQLPRFVGTEDRYEGL